MRRALLCAIAVGIAVTGLFARCGMAQDVPPGFGAAPFARIGVDARSLAMGGAGVAVAAGATSPYYNPSLLANAPMLDVGGMYSEPYGQDLGISFQSLCVQGQLGDVADATTSVGVSLTWMQMSISDIPVWDEDDPTATYYFTATSSLYLVSAGVWILPELSMGLSGRIYRENVLEGRGRGLGVDLAALASFDIEGIPVWVGINSMDVGQTNVRWHDTLGEPDNYVPWVNKVGVAALLFERRGLLALDFDWAVGRPLREQKFHLGVEGRPVDALTVRAGWTGDLEGLDPRLTFGVGIDFFDSFRLDYAYVPPRTIYGTGHFLSLHLTFPLPEEWLNMAPGR